MVKKIAKFVLLIVLLVSVFSSSSWGMEESEEDDSESQHSHIHIRQFSQEDQESFDPLTILPSYFYSLLRNFYISFLQKQESPNFLVVCPNKILDIIIGFMGPDLRTITSLLHTSKQTFEQCKSVVKAVFPRCKMNEERLFQIVTWFPNLEDLNLAWNCSIEKEALRRLSFLSKIKILNLNACHIDSEGFKNLSNLSLLHTLSLSKCDQINNNVLKYLSSLSNIQFLDVSCKKIDNEGLKLLSCLLNIRWLGLRTSAIDNEGLKLLSCLSNIECLDVSSCDKIDHEGIRYLSALVNLKNLDLSCCQRLDNAEGLKYLSNLQNIQWLGLSSYWRMGDEGFRYLSSLSKIKTLNLFSCKIGDEGLNHLSGLTNLQILNLSDIEMITKYTHKGLNYLSHLTKLKTRRKLEWNNYPFPGILGGVSPFRS